MGSNSRLVYSTLGEVCPLCGWPVATCACGTRQDASDKVPSRVVAKLRLEKAGRGGKAVTVVYDLPRNESFLRELSQELKKACGVGGAVRETSVEVQGDQRERLRAHLSKKGYIVKG